MKKIFYTIQWLFIINAAINFSAAAQEMPNGFKTTVDMTIDDKGSVVCEYGTKYNAVFWDNFQRTIGSNTSILKNMLIRQFPKYALSEFNYSQDANNRSNKVTFKIDGMMTINKNGKWMADLEQKDPDITKASPTEFLLLESGNTLKIHLPSGTDDAKVEKDSFGKAMLTYPANEGGPMGRIFLYIGLAAIAGGAFLLYRNMKKATPGIRTMYESSTGRRTAIPEAETAHVISTSSPAGIPPMGTPGAATPAVPGKNGQEHI